MADTWITDLTHFLDENGEMIKEPPQARKLGEYLAAIVVMASYPDPEYPPEYKVLCRRRPKRKPCLTEIAGWLDPETDDVVWICPVCQDKGIISNWRGTIWDMRVVKTCLPTALFRCSGRSGKGFCPRSASCLSGRSKPPSCL